MMSDSKYDKSTPQSIQKMFGSIANRYDRANSILSLSLHKSWNKKLAQKILFQAKPKSLLDLCAGTGDIAFECIKQSNNLENITLLDFCEEMLECAKEKAKKLAHSSSRHIQYLHADALKIPLMHESVDSVSIAYGIRNVSDPGLCFTEVYRVLKTGGTFGILELTRPENSLLKVGHKMYLKTILPVAGKLLTQNKEAYRYLCSSIKKFIPPYKLIQMLIDAGFSDVRTTALSGGIASIITCKKIG